jgi:serine/threonine protein kinase
MLICELMRKDLHRHLHTLKIMGYIIMKILKQLKVSSRFNSITLCSTLKQSDAGAMLLSYSRQVASAMVYLSGKGYVHCDLAARNILLSEDGVCKVNL